MIRFGTLCFFALIPMSCEAVKDAVQQGILTCTDACTQVETCAATPPSPVFGSLGKVSSGEGGVDCAVGCSADDRELRGYSDCQIDCLVHAKCGEINDCWAPKSDLYAEYCLADVTIPDIGPGASIPDPGNGSVSGSTAADDLLDDPAVEIAVDDASGDGFVVNYGDSPPKLVGKYDVHGKIDKSRNARPVGSVIDTSICFWDYAETGGGIEVSYCEDGVPGKDHAPLTGTNDAFTAYFEYPGQATVLFSGSMNQDGTLSNVEALVVYTYATKVWELSHTDWTPNGTCDSCSQ